MSDNSTREEIRAQKVEELRESEGAESDADASAGESGAGPSEPVHVNGRDELQEVVGEYDVVLADFYADWCGPCQMLEPVVADVAAETDAAVAKVDVDANQQLAAEYGVRGVPTLVLFAGGEAVDQMVGVQGKDALVAAVEQHG